MRPTPTHLPPPQLWKKINTIWGKKLLQVSRSGVQSSAAGGLALHEVFAPKLPKAAAKPKAKQVDSQQANKAWGGWPWHEAEFRMSYDFCCKQHTLSIISGIEAPWISIQFQHAVFFREVNYINIYQT